jgi:hypothetical protein
MTHLNEEQLIVYSLGDSKDLAAVERHLAECPACKAEFDAIRRTLNMVDAMPLPHRGEDYGTQVWYRIRPRLQQRESIWASWFGWPRLAAAGALAALVITAFLAGRHYPFRDQPRQQVAQNEVTQAGNRLLLVTLREHLDQSQRMLVELANSDTGSLEVEKQTAEDLLASNRLYRQSALRVGDPAVAQMLDDLEVFLVEAAHARPEELPALQRRLAEKQLLFQLRVMNANLRERQLRSLPTASN